jgi:integration host factor subunit alpha
MSAAQDPPASAAAAAIPAPGSNRASGARGSSAGGQGAHDHFVPAGGTPTLQALATPTLTKAELAELLFEQLGLNKRESKDMVEAFFNLVHASLVAGTDVKLSGFGNFQIRDKKARPGRNPRTGEAIPIQARKVVTFHASNKLKAIVQGDTAAAEEFE